MTETIAAPLLAIELIPKPLWRRNLHDEPWWPTESRRRRREQPLCEICCDDKAGTKVRVPAAKGGYVEVFDFVPSQEVHEVWTYDDENHVQTLVRLIALCRACHEVKHFGLATIKGRALQATEHLMRVNGWDKDQAKAHIAEARAQWVERSRYPWTQDLGVFDHPPT
jgi:hypothetical protein